MPNGKVTETIQDKQCQEIKVSTDGTQAGTDKGWQITAICKRLQIYQIIVYEIRNALGLGVRNAI